TNFAGGRILRVHRREYRDSGPARPNEIRDPRGGGLGARDGHRCQHRHHDAPNPKRPLHGFLLRPYPNATPPAPSSRPPTRFKSRRFDSPANNVGPWPASLGCITNSYSSINPSSANASGSFTPPTSSPLPDSRLSC